MKLLDYLPENRKNEEFGDSNWDFIEVSNVNDKIIKILLDKLSLGISEDFFISFESLMKIGKKAKSQILSFIKTQNPNSFIRDLLYLILQYINEGDIDTPLIFQLYHPDFVKRAKSIKDIMEMEKDNYFKYIIPLIDDPDDSVRFRVLKYLISQELIQNPIIENQLKERLKKELNPIIINKIKEILNRTS